MKTYFLLLASIGLWANDWIDLEENPDPFVLEVRKIEIPGFPTAFNPSIVRFQDKYLLSFRDIPNKKTPFTTILGFIFLDLDFNPLSPPQILETRPPSSTVPPRAEDGRLIWMKDHLYMVYDDNEDQKISKGGFRLYLAELHYINNRFHLFEKEKISRYEGASPNVREKAWTPFIYENQLLLSYTLHPHKVFSPWIGRGFCKTVAETCSDINWAYGTIRGGTPALQGIAENNEYFGFFHSSIRMESKHSEGEKMLHYFIGAFTFSPYPPFEITKISRQPITAKQFYSGEAYQPYWHPLRVVFPAGYVFDEKYIYMVYGRQDHEIWVAKLDRKALLQSLVPVSLLQE